MIFKKYIHRKTRLDELKKFDAKVKFELYFLFPLMDKMKTSQRLLQEAYVGMREFKNVYSARLEKGDPVEVFDGNKIILIQTK